MIRAVPEQEMNSAAPSPAEENPAAAPLVLIPVSAEDFARRKKRIVRACIAAAVTAMLLIGYVYKRSVDPIHAQESFDAGVRFLNVARYGQAILSFDRAVALKPDLADAYYFRAKAYVSEADNEHAIQDFSKLIELRPQDARGFLGRCARYQEQKNFAATIADCSRALALDPRLAEAYNLRGMATRDSGNAGAAIADFTRAVELAPDTDNYYQRGATYQLLGEHQLAIADLDQVIASVPSESQAYFARAESRRAVGDVKGAEADHTHGRILDGR